MMPLLGLLTGWVMLSPLLLVIYFRLGGPFFPWMAPIASIAMSIPMLGFFTIAGFVLIFFSVRAYARPRDDF